jgi:NhaP-type Na+/H+ or K+/H+ antiporter
MTPGSDEYLTVVQQVARVTLAISVMGAALRLPEGYVRRHWRELTLIGLPLMSLSGSVLAYLILPVPLLTAFLIGSLLAPTDPILAHSVITGKTADENIPARLRNSITAESGANDGRALLLVMFPVPFLTYPPGEAVAHWLTETVAWGVLGAIAVGLGLGWLAGKMLVWAYAQPFSERVSGLTASVALALATVAWVHLIGSSGILAAFAAGLVFQRFLVRVEDPRTEHVQEAIGRFFDLPVFVLFGLSVPWHDWLALDWTALAFTVAVLLLRRPPVWLLLQPMLRSLENRREALFNGWFGPIGIAALFYAAEATHITELYQVWTLASLVVFASVLVHGISATPLIRRYGGLIARAPSRERIRERAGSRSDPGSCVPAQ